MKKLTTLIAVLTIGLAGCSQPFAPDCDGFKEPATRADTPVSVEFDCEVPND